MTSSGGLLPGRRRRRAAGGAAAVGTGGRRAGRRGGRRGQRLPRRRHLRHGRHLDRRVPDRRRCAGARPPQREVGGFTVRFPSLDVHTIGAGGGSIARIDPGRCAGGRAPRAPGADPGPACYGRGGDRADGDRRQPGGRAHPRRRPRSAACTLDRAAAARRRSTRAGVTAEGVLDVVDANMERALRAVSVERGVDPARASRSSPSAAPGRCTPARWPTRWACPPWSCRPGPACCRPSGC